MTAVLNLLTGLVGGYVGGLVGLGGGVVMIPIMVSLRRISQHQAHGTSLVAVVFTGVAGAATYMYYGSVSWGASLILAANAIATAFTGARFAGSLSEAKLKKAFGFFLVVVSIVVLVAGALGGGQRQAGAVVVVVVLILAGAVTGFLSGMMGVGGGTVMIPAMVLLAGMEQHVAQGTSLLAMVPIGIVGSLTHHRLANVRTGMLPGLIAGVIVGTYLGGSTASYLPELYLRLAFSAVLIFVGLRYVGVRLTLKGDYE